MSQNWQADVAKLHEVFRCYTRQRPEIPPDHVVDLRVKLITEEYRELMAAIIKKDIPGIADGIVDLIVVAIGTGLAYGIDLRPIWDVVHRANMRKWGGGVREDGKILKPPDWQPPDIVQELLFQGWQK
jgi:predicted HAD superfamily Cof-like phosphohydrolase